MDTFHYYGVVKMTPSITSQTTFSDSVAQHICLHISVLKNRPYNLLGNTLFIYFLQSKHWGSVKPAVLYFIIKLGPV